MPIHTNDIETKLAGVLVGAPCLASQTLQTHYHTMAGPVVAAAKAAIERENITPVLI